MLKDIIYDYMKDKRLKYSILIKDLAGKKSLSINENEAVSSASVIKLYIMGKAFELASRGELNLGQRISIDRKNRVPGSVIYALDENNTYTIKDLVTLMIMQSDNTATNELIDILGMEAINKFAADKGFKDTVLKRKMMDFEARVKGLDNYTTAQDVSRFLELIYNGQLIDKTYSDEMLEILKLQLDNSMMKIDIDDEVTIAHKTGDLTNIKHDAGIVYTKSKTYIFTMLTWDACSNNYARNIIGKVSRITYDYFTSEITENTCYEC